MINRIASSAFRASLNSQSLADNVSIKLVASSAHEVSFFWVMAGSADIAVAFYDTNDITKLDPKNAVYLGSNQGESRDYAPPRAAQFKKGIVISIEEGGVPFNGIAGCFID